MKRCSIEGCDSPVRVIAVGMCNAHYKKHRKYGDAATGYQKRQNGSGTVTAGGYRTVAHQYEHILIAEAALGHPLPTGAKVHHVDGNRARNVGTNLVICPSEAYHQLLHLRQRALEACGHAGWRKCNYCKRWDDPANLKISTIPRRPIFHSDCANAYRRNHNRKEAA